MVSDDMTKTRKLTQDLIASVTARQRVDLVNDDKTQIAKQANHVVGAVDEHRLQ